MVSQGSSLSPLPGDSTLPADGGGGMVSLWLPATRKNYNILFNYFGWFNKLWNHKCVQNVQ